MIRRLVLAAAASAMLVACVAEGSVVNRAKLGKPAAAQPTAEAVDDHDQKVRDFLAEIGACVPDAVQEWRGRTLIPGAEATLLEKSGAATLRLVRPGEAVTMDYQTDRLTVELDEAGVIRALRCG